jgi:hypothetical protein
MYSDWETVKYGYKQSLCFFSFYQRDIISNTYTVIFTFIYHHPSPIKKDNKLHMYGMSILICIATSVVRCPKFVCTRTWQSLNLSTLFSGSCVLNGCYSTVSQSERVIFWFLSSVWALLNSRPIWTHNFLVPPYMSRIHFYTHSEHKNQKIMCSDWATVE